MGESPAADRAWTCRMIGDSSEAETVAAELTAKPSIAEVSNGGVKVGLTTV